MQFTLDSITHVEESLKEANKGKEVNSFPVIINDLNDVSKLSNRLYFGILTVGSNVTKAVLKDENDNEIITILKNSQIIEFFSEVSFLDDLDAELATPKGHFRGFEIQIK
ncbi:hypothetical protein [Wocania ichthyoenteri]|uniref:hypothetical protein n=1 Tax=Wocania ichthyoenteri TaxID=1230531 RepID=UPI00053EC941|nr:hypothetical protein [Wocania ichthyoenteri]